MTETELPAGWREVLDQIDEKHSSSHTRLRGDLRGLETTVESNFRHFDDQTRILRAEISAATAAASIPIDATKLVLTTPVVVSICGAVAVIVVSVFAANSGIRSDIRDINTKVDAQAKAMEAASALQTSQMTQIRDASNDAKAAAADARRQYELLRYEFQAMKESLTKGKQ